MPSLDPAGTAAVWTRLAHGHWRLAGAATSDCRPLRAVFYAPTDWRRLATKLAANASACAQYYISVPPLESDKTQERSDEAWRIRALGANFHALAEINMSAWGTWVTDGGGTWYQAGVQARKNMAAAGFDVSEGDTWAVNEFSSAVRQGSGSARADARNFVHGLFDGDGTLPTARGVVWTVGIGQGTTYMTTYKTNLENWLQDSAFWSDMNAYVSDWSQEVYGDFRNYGVAGSTLPTRRDYLKDYLQHVLVLANAGPDTIATARTYLQTTYGPLANAAWQWASGYGWTSIPYDQMENYVSAQTYALRSFSATNAQAQDHWGFAWAPNNSTGLSSTDFTAQTGAILDRLAAAIHDSAEPVDPTDPGIGACGPLGQNLWCNGQIDGAWFNDAWKTFQVWALPPTISSFTPTSGPAGTNVTITGGHLSGATGVTFNGTSAAFTINSDSQITTTAPTGATTGPIAVTTLAGTATSSTNFTITTTPAPPTISAFTPTSGLAGTGVTITGTTFSGATTVAFNGTSASFTVDSDSQISATVPPAATTGPISVATPGGTATSSTNFTVTTTGAPTISSFSPGSGRAGATVTILGNGFTGATSVTFNGTLATYTLNSDSQITTNVPAGATSGPISVTTPAGTATSSKSFKVRSAAAVKHQGRGSRKKPGRLRAARAGGDAGSVFAPAARAAPSVG